MAVQRIDEAVLGMVRDSMSPADFAVLLGLFRNDMAERVASLRLALAGPDRDLLERTLHQMVGTAGNMGATDLADAAREIERTAATAPADSLRRDLGALILLVGETQAAIDALARPGG